jgi:two-component system alkaline phosphatase synthesis response regulator PhoP
MKVLIAEDDKFTREGLQEILDSEGYVTETAQNGNEALSLYEEWKPDFLCLDIMMPEMNGYDVCKVIRSKNDNVPIIFISAKSEEIDKVIGLELGADDFIAKPFGVKEVIARVRAVTRRYLKSGKKSEFLTPFEFGSYLVQPSQLIAENKDKRRELSLREIKILKVLSENKGSITRRNELLKKCWEIESGSNTRTLDQHIAQLRKKIEENPQDPSLILTVHGMGYRYDG